MQIVTSGENQIDTRTPAFSWGVVLAAIIVGGLALRLAMLPVNGLPGDAADFVGWTLTIVHFGTHGLYGNAQSYGGHVVDNPPGYPLILAAIGSFYNAVRPANDPDHRLLRMLLKLPAIVADLGLCTGLFLLARRCWSTRAGLIAAAIVAFSPSTWLISAYWGQVDSISAAFLVFALVFAVRERYSVSWLFLAVAVLVKAQPLVIAPLLFVWQWRTQGTSLRLLTAPLVGFTVAYLGSVLFAPSAQPVATFSWLLQQYITGAKFYPYTSVSAFNIYTVAGSFLQPDDARVLGLAVSTWGLLAFGALLCAVTITFARALTVDREAVRERALFTACFIVLAGLFVVTTRMHERYLFAALTLAPLLWLAGGWLRAVAATMLVTFTANCLLVLDFVAYGGYHRGTPLLIHGFSLLNVVGLMILTIAFVGGQIQRRPMRDQPRAVLPSTSR